MKWHVIDKKNCLVPEKGGYRDWKPQLSQESKAQCVYCCIHESKFGGIRNFHVEHHRPQSIFPLLRDSYPNLFYACGICNVFKSDDWPADPVVGDYSFASYPDPSTDDYGLFISVDPRSGIAASPTIAGSYVIERLYLNRPQIVALRVFDHLLQNLRESFESLKMLHRSKSLLAEHLDAYVGLLEQQGELLTKLQNARPYAIDQVKRSK